ncbi:hypothetical protein N181_02005 [Sinorhizobium fredii USDA 205]|uniref:DUF4168 domain-containing protein n=3 Tax=Rhizobium fredii TaxID=380 RepID=A0A844A8D9_RHIFR|nr:hypothetical protein [Sinorhizobium fredii]ASY73048.1 hypothetical protein SF83666_b63990 [Sinorhizobium fredii CCBAU 83666]AWM29191.1 hypothetical protein AOX55_00006416 [Sinorhizobium fredii CCBAU 25509]KSV86063.1 hypothetical protein N181_02005 [Sinorhizobium fredii USDA 205]MCG5473885.1 hypothetical protein [Sinorhizobium fredii]MQW93545.1 hypothetical protein [Sinorhizobium fredii]
MRSLITTSAIAALALSLAAGGAFAASRHEGTTSTGPENGDYYQGIFGNDDVAPPAPDARPMTSAVVVQQPRLATILHELHAANHRMDAERASGKLGPVAFNRLRREESGIRADATEVAAMHHGMIPTSAYAQLQRDVRRLDWNIARSA